MDSWLQKGLQQAVSCADVIEGGKEQYSQPEHLISWEKVRQSSKALNKDKQLDQIYLYLHYQIEISAQKCILALSVFLRKIFVPTSTPALLPSVERCALTLWVYVSVSQTRDNSLICWYNRGLKTRIWHSAIDWDFCPAGSHSHKVPKNSHRGLH